MPGDTRMSPRAPAQAKQPAGIRMHGPGTGSVSCLSRTAGGSGTSERTGKGVGTHLPEPSQLLLWEGCSTFRTQKYRDYLHCAQLALVGIQCLLFRTFSSKKLVPRLTWKETSTMCASILLKEVVLWRCNESPPSVG